MKSLLAVLLAFLGGTIVGWLLQRELLAPPPAVPMGAQQSTPPREAFRSSQMLRCTDPTNCGYAIRTSSLVPPQVLSTPHWDAHLPRLSDQQVWQMLLMAEQQGHVYVRGPSGGGAFIQLEVQPDDSPLVEPPGVTGFSSGWKTIWLTK